MASGSKFNTFNVTPAKSPYRIIGGMNVLTCTFKMSNASGDAATIEGSAELNNASGSAQPSEPIDIEAGEAGIIQGAGAPSPIDGITINVTQGSLRLIMAQ